MEKGNELVIIFYIVIFKILSNNYKINSKFKFHAKITMKFPKQDIIPNYRLVEI